MNPEFQAFALSDARHVGWARALLAVPLLVFASISAPGCGNTLYSVQANSAAGKLAEARELGAEHYAPYEFTMASEYFAKAQTEAAEADYSDATELSKRAEALAETAITLSRDAHRGARR